MHKPNKTESKQAFKSSNQSFCDDFMEVVSLFLYAFILMSAQKMNKYITGHKSADEFIIISSSAWVETGS